MDRDSLERGHAGAIRRYDPAREAGAHSEQCGPGADAAGVNPGLVEVVAGIIEAGETPADVGQREAVEEAGCSVTALHPIGTFFVTPGGSSETVAIYCGRTDSSGAGGIHGLDHEHEDIRVLVLSRQEALDRLAAGAIANVTAVVALQWLALNHTEIMRIWK